MNWNFQEILTKDPSSAWGCDTSGNIPPCWVALRRTCRCTEIHRVKRQICVTRPQCVNNLYSSPNIVRVIKSRRMRWAGHIVRMGKRTGVYMVLVGKTEGRRPLGWSRCRWEDNIKLNVQEVGCGGMVWMELAQDRDRLWHLLMR